MQKKDKEISLSVRARQPYRLVRSSSVWRWLLFTCQEK